MQNSIISEDDKKKIIDALEKKGAIKECPRCSTKQFSLVDGYFNQYLQKSMNSVQLGGPNIPSIAVICTNCGYLSQHALGALGLMNIASK